MKKLALTTFALVFALALAMPAFSELEPQDAVEMTPFPDFSYLYVQGDALFTPASWWPPCNQGAYCTSQNDPICGPEGFCNLGTNCCMCY